MRRLNKYIIQFAVVAAALLLIPFECRASVEREREGSASISLAGSASQIGDWAAQSSRYSLDMLGITEMECNCTFTFGEDGRSWLFNAEPEIKGVDPDGPSYGQLKDGDVIVSIDGMLITTRKAGIRFANLVAGEPVALTVRRRGRTRSVTVLPQEAPEAEVPVALTVRRSGSKQTVDVEPLETAFPDMARSIEELSRRSVEIGKAIVTMGLPDSPEFPTLPEFNIDFSKMAPRGWIGFGLSFGGSIKNKDQGKPAEWRFNEPPVIKSVQPGSPADEAGLQVNDVLLEIDGLKLNSSKGGKRFSSMEPGQIIAWKVQRGGKTFTVETKAGERPRREQAEALPEPLDPDASQPLRFAGAMGGAEVEVHGSENVKVEVDEETGEIVVRSSDSVVRVRSKDRR